MCETEIIINGEAYVKKSNAAPSEKVILIGQRGWVFVGNKTTNGDEVILTDASVVRKWGTTKGLGEIALSGPTPDTKLDPCGTIRMNKLAVVAEINVNVAKWR